MLCYHKKMKKRRKSQRCRLCDAPASTEDRIFNYVCGRYEFYCEEHFKSERKRIHEPDNWRERVLEMQAYREGISERST